MIHLLINHATTRCKEEKVDIFEVMSHLVTCINIRCILGEKAYKDHADEISRIYFQLENNGIGSALRFNATIISRLLTYCLLAALGATTAAVNTFSMMFPNLPSPTKIKNEKARERLVEIITNLLTSDEGKVQLLSRLQESPARARGAHTCSSSYMKNRRPRTTWP